MSPMLTVTRNMPIDVGVRQVYLSLDGAHLATLVAGESVSRPVDPGRHVLSAHNTLVRKSLEFEAVAGQDLFFRVANRAGFASWLAQWLGAGPLYVTLEPAAAAAAETGHDADL